MPRRTSPTGKSSKPARTVRDAAVQSVRGSGNVFVDLQIPDPDVALAKARLVQRIRDIITDRGLTQAQAAALLNLDQPKVSALMRGRVAGYSLDRLFRLLNALGQDIEILLREPRRGGGSGSGGQRGTLVAR